MATWGPVNDDVGQSPVEQNGVEDNFMNPFGSQNPFAPQEDNSNPFAPQEQPDTECFNINDNRVKFINNKYEKPDANMRENTDVKLKVGRSNLKAQKKVLMAASEYFSDLFTKQTKGKEQEEIELTDVKGPGLSAMLEYFYHGYVTVDTTTVEAILEAAKLYKIDWVTEVCGDFLASHLYLVNYPLTMELADRFSLGDLRWEIFKNFGQNLPALVNRKTFYKDLSADFLLQFLMEYMFVEAPESSLLQMIVQWVKEDEANRKEHLLPLLRQLRFCSMELDELEDIPKEVLEFQEIRDEVEEAKNYCLDIAGQCLKEGDKFQFRGSRKAITLLNFNQEGNTVMYKDTEHPNLFVEKLNMSNLAIDYGSSNQAAIGQFLFAAGGYNEEFTSSSKVFRYDSRFRDWTEIAHMNEARVSFAMCSSKNRLYVIGGVFHTAGDVEESSEKILSSVEMYNPEENSWKKLTDLPYPSFDQAAVHCDGKLYVTGGISALPTHPVPMGTALCLSEGANSWTQLPFLLTPRQGHSMTAHNGKLYVLGGFTCGANSAEFLDCPKNEAFDLEVNQWTSLTNTPEGFGHIFRHVALLDNRIHFLCGCMGELMLNSYDTDRDEFEDGIMVGSSQKLAILPVAYPLT